jgi:type IV pilus assembly protein PilE
VERNRIRASAGFTLIELMVTVAVIAILTGIAYPSYQDHVRKGRRAAAQAFIVDAATRQQQYLLDARGYALGAGALTALNLNVPADVASAYTITVTPAAATVPPTFTITATPIAGSNQVPDGALTFNQEGSKTRAGQPGW